MGVIGSWGRPGRKLPICLDRLLKLRSAEQFIEMPGKSSAKVYLLIHRGVVGPVWPSRTYLKNHPRPRDRYGFSTSLLAERVKFGRMAS